MRIGKLWPLAAGLALILFFVGLERTPPVRAEFTLVGTVDCGRSSGQACSLGDTITIISKDSGAPTKYTIDISWLKELPALDQDDYVSIDIEKIGQILMAQKLTDISGQPGTGNPGTRGAKSTTTTISDDDAVGCTGDSIEQETVVFVFDTTAAFTSTLASTTVFITNLVPTFFTVTELPCGGGEVTSSVTTTSVTTASTE